ncbi:MAG: sigma-70 family RNA polymerase sigma factor [Nitrospirae bacterium]|nr:sigma-70 family RNA polymerase sigma factor [Nitrospirota bacterium]
MMLSGPSQAISLSMYQQGHQLPELIPDPHVLNRVHPGSRSSETTTMKELQLVQGLRNGNEAAFSSLIDRYHTQLIRLARAFVPSQAVAEEVVQETWLAVLQGITRFEGRSSLKTWLFQILTNRAKTRGRQESRYVSFSDAANQTDQEEEIAMEPERFHPSGHLTGHWTIRPTTWDENTPERLLLSKEGLAQIEKAIQALPANQRQVIILRDFEGIDSEEICHMLHITLTNQRVLLHRARCKIRAVLEAYLKEHPTGLKTQTPFDLVTA